jgi:hypothetical protein
LVIIAGGLKLSFILAGRFLIFSPPFVTRTGAVLTVAEIV